MEVTLTLWQLTGIVIASLVGIATIISFADHIWSQGRQVRYPR